MTPPPQQRFGMAIRGLRLRYHWPQRLGRYIRVTTAEGPCWRIELATEPSNWEAGEHVCWWDEPEVIEDLPALQGLKPPLTVYLNDDGEVA